MIKNVPYCWQHIPEALKKKYLTEKVSKGMVPMKDGTASRSETLAHMLRVYGNTPEEKEVVEPQLINVFTGSRGWQGRVYINRGKVRAHIIVQKTPPLGRFVRQEFDNVRLGTFKKHVKQSGALYIQSVGVEKQLRRKGVSRTMINSFSGAIWLHAENAGPATAYKRMGFREIPELSEPPRLFMVRGP